MLFSRRKLTGAQLLEVLKLARDMAQSEMRVHLEVDHTATSENEETE